MTSACPASELAADTCLLKLQRPQNKVLCTIADFPRCTSVRDLHMAFNLPYVYDYIINLCRQQAEVMQNLETEPVRGIGQGEARHRKYKRLKLGGGQTDECPTTQLSSESEAESYVTTDGQSASLSWYKAPIRGLRADFFFSVRNTEYV
jgi:hypothetical protein